MPNRQILGGHRVSDLLSMLAIGVTLFFTLSGFLLYRPFAASIVRGEMKLPIRAYFTNRVLRIAPAYWAILALTLVVGAASVRNASGTIRYAGHITDPVAMLQSALLLQDYRPSTMVIGIGPAWSLAVEVVFYCVLPLLALGAAYVAAFARDRRGRVLVVLGPPLLLLLIGLSGKHAAHGLGGSPTNGYGTNWHSLIERSFWAQADLFSFGMIVAVLYTEVSDGRLAVPRHWRRIVASLGAIVFLPCAWTMHGGEQSYLPQNTGEALAISMVFATIVIPAGDGGASWVVRLLESRALVAVGVVSYSLFLWHFPVISWLQSHGLTLGGGWGALLLNLIEASLVTGALSALTYRYVERPALRRKRSTRTTDVAPAPADAVTAPAPT
jgi:peptidoglycan/LPS O-acetylase OafA/YrhL